MYRNRIAEHITIDAAELRRNPLNHRHPDSQRHALRSLLGSVGIVDELLAYRDPVHGLTLVDGEARWSEGGAWPVAVLDLTPDEAMTVLAMLDQIGAQAEIDPEALLALLDSLPAEARQTAGAAWSDDELAALLGEPAIEPGAGGDEFDATPDEGPTRTNLGELWSIGGVHRLLVGDCTDAANVARLMGGERAQLILTSPPYGVGMEYEGDAGFDETVSLVTAALLLSASYVQKNGFAFVNFGDRWTFPKMMGQVYLDIFQSAGWRWYDFRFWKRDSVGMAIWNTTQPHALSSVESLFTFQNGTGGYPVHDLSISKEPIWEAPGSSTGMDHPAVMALGIAEKAAQIYTQRNELIIEPFLGSGTTLIAAHRTGRRCYGMEIAPRYADVILRRAEAEGLTVERATD